MEICWVAEKSSEKIPYTPTPEAYKISKSGMIAIGCSKNMFIFLDQVRPQLCPVPIVICSLV